MADIDRLINLKEELKSELEGERDFIEQYVRLRNLYCDLLVTNPVNVVETVEWLRHDTIEIKGVVRGKLLVGVAILYLNRMGEIAIFSSIKGSGLGDRLLSATESDAKEKGLGEVWAWVLFDNVAANRLFLKNGYLRDENSTRLYRGEVVNGSVFRKKFRKDEDR